MRVWQSFPGDNNNNNRKTNFHTIARHTELKVVQNAHNVHRESNPAINKVMCSNDIKDYTRRTQWLKSECAWKRLTVAQIIIILQSNRPSIGRKMSSSIHVSMNTVRQYYGFHSHPLEYHCCGVCACAMHIFLSTLHIARACILLFQRSEIERKKFESEKGRTQQHHIRCKIHWFYRISWM